MVCRVLPLLPDTPKQMAALSFKPAGETGQATALASQRLTLSRCYTVSAAHEHQAKPYNAKQVVGWRTDLPVMMPTALVVQALPGCLRCPEAGRRACAAHGCCLAASWGWLRRVVHGW